MPVVSTVTCADQRHLLAAAVHRPLGAEHRRLRLQQVLAGLDDDGVDAAVEHADDLLAVGVAQRLGTARGRASAAWCPDPTEPSTNRGRPSAANSSASARASSRAGAGELLDPVGDVVLGEVGQVRAERVRLDRVHADLEVGAVDRPDDVGPGDVQDLVAALEAGEVVQRRVLRLQHRAHRAVGDHHALARARSAAGGRSRRWVDCHPA